MISIKVLLISRNMPSLLQALQLSINSGHKYLTPTSPLPIPYYIHKKHKVYNC